MNSCKHPEPASGNYSRNRIFAVLPLPSAEDWSCCCYEQTI